MKKILLLFFFFIGMVAAQAQTRNQAQSKDEREVAAAVESLKKAMLSGERQALERIAAPELTYGHSNGTIEDRAAFVEALASGKNDFVTIDLSDQSIKIVGPTALVRHNLMAQTNNEGTPGTANIGILLVWQKQQGQWKLLARQAFKR
jgi:ketosteroid isomerase-like protein